MASQVHEGNAYRFLDCFAVVSEDGIMFYGCEHNQEEAQAVARWITYNRGRKAVVITNSPDQVRAAKTIRGGQPTRYELREEALRDMGVWK